MIEPIELEKFVEHCQAVAAKKLHINVFQVSLTVLPYSMLSRFSLSESEWLKQAALALAVVGLIWLAKLLRDYMLTRAEPRKLTITAAMLVNASPSLREQITATRVIGSHKERTFGKLDDLLTIGSIEGGRQA